ncbi:MAG: hypothetical protein ACKO4T_09925 [Planctomycetaceae bacterium]
MPLLAAALLALLASISASAAERPPADWQGDPAVPEFLRLVRDDAGEPVSLDTAVVAYREDAAAAARAGRKTPLEIDLVAAVHVGGAGYYETLDRLFADYDAVLYELVAPPNARVPKPGRRPAGAIGSAQQSLRSMLGLEFQLESIDYAADNFVHADLSPKEFDAAMAKRGESWWGMFLKLMRESMARADQGGGGQDVSVGDLFGILFSSGPERQVRLRRMMAEQFTDMDVLTAAFGDDEGSTLITDRNAAALRVLGEQVAAGRRRIAIFYGAAHMEDFDRRLRADFGLQPDEPEWLEAWDLREPAAARR